MILLLFKGAAIPDVVASGTRVLTFSTAVANRLTLSTGTGIRKTLSLEG